jgi:hypothetical protein
VTSFEITLSVAFAILTVAVAVFFIYRQQATLRSVRADTTAPPEERRFLIRQSVRRTFSCGMLILLAVMVFGSVFLDYDPLSKPASELPLVEQAAAKDSVRFLSIYVMTLLLVLMAVMALAILDLLATARHGVWQKKRLLQEHQDALEAELAEIRHRQAEMN